MGGRGRGMGNYGGGGGTNLDMKIFDPIIEQTSNLTIDSST